MLPEISTIVKRILLNRLRPVSSLFKHSPEIVLQTEILKNSNIFKGTIVLKSLF